MELAVGDRVQGRLTDAARPPVGLFKVAGSDKAIAPLVGRTLVACESHSNAWDRAELLLFHNRTAAGTGFEPVSERLLPLDEDWRRGLAAKAWPTRYLPQMPGDTTARLRGTIHRVRQGSIDEELFDVISGIEALSSVAPR